jgi:hypothetical protein
MNATPVRKNPALDSRNTCEQRQVWFANFRIKIFLLLEAKRVCG